MDFLTKNISAGSRCFSPMFEVQLLLLIIMELFTHIRGCTELGEAAARFPAKISF